MRKRTMRILGVALAASLAAALPGFAGGSKEPVPAAGGKRSLTHLSITLDAQWNVDLMASEIFKKWNALAHDAGFDLEMNSLPHSEYGNKVTIMFASGDLTDLVWDGALTDRQKTGMIIPLTKYLSQEKYKALKASTSETGWTFARISGDTWGVGSPIATAPQRGDMIRGDWLESLGLSMPKTLDDIKSVFHQFTYNDPDKNGKQDTYAASFRKDFQWFDGFWGPYGLQSYTWSPYPLPCFEVDGKLACQYTTKNYKEFLAFIRGLWADGNFDPNSFLNSEQQWKQMWGNNRVGYIHHYAYNARTYFTQQTLEISGNKNARWDAVYDGIRGPYGQGTTTDRPTGRYLMITSKCKTPEAAMDYIQWSLCPNDAQKELLKWGIEGQNYVVKDGVKYRNPEGWTGSRDKVASLGSADMFPKGVNPPLSQLESLIFFAAIDKGDDAYMSARYGEYGLGVLRKLVVWPQDTKLLGMPVLESDSKVPEMNKLVLEHMTKIITGNEELDAGFSKLQADLKNAGLDSLMAERQKWYDAGGGKK